MAAHTKPSINSDFDTDQAFLYLNTWTTFCFSSTATESTEACIW